MKIAYRKDNAGIVAIEDGLNADLLAGGLALLVCGDVPGVLDADGQVIPGKTLADAPGAAELLKADICARIDNKTGADILAGFDYRGVHFKLTAEDQLNFANAYVAREDLPYPLPVKGAGLVFLTLADAAEVKAFYLAGLAFVQGRLAAGWAAKLALDSLTLAELAAYEVAA